MTGKWLDDEELQNILGLPAEEKQENENQTVSAKHTPEEHSYNVPKKEVETRGVQFEELSPDSYSEAEIAELQLLFDVPLEVRVLLGSVEKTIEEILDMEEGNILQTERLAGEPVEIMVENHIIARGETVIIEDKFGVLITEIVPPSERIERATGKLKRQK